MNNTTVHHERVAAAFAGRWADRVAVCEHAFASSVASELFGRPLHTGSTELHFHEALNVRALEELGAEFVVGVPMGMAVPMEPGWLEATAVEPQLFADYFDLHVQRMFAEIDFWRERGVRLIDFGGDFAFNSGPVYSPRFFATVMAPRWKRLYDRCRELGLWCIQRSDGNLWPVAQTLFGWAKPHAYYECDYDAGMHFDDLRSAFPELVLMGNVSSDRVSSEGHGRDSRQTVLADDVGRQPGRHRRSLPAVLPVRRAMRLRRDSG